MYYLYYLYLKYPNLYSYYYFVKSFHFYILFTNNFKKCYFHYFLVYHLLLSLIEIYNSNYKNYSIVIIA